MDIGLKYVGNGDWLPGVPARDLTIEEARRHGRNWLMMTRLYEKPPKRRRKKSEVNDGRD